MPKDSDEHVEAQAPTLAEISKIDTEAADAAHKAAMDELEAQLAAIDAGTVEAPEVIEHLEELLDAAPEATATAAAPDDKTGTNDKSGTEAVEQEADDKTGTDDSDANDKSGTNDSDAEAFERDWADLEAKLAAIDAGTVEAPEVVEHLEELLDAAPGATTATATAPDETPKAEPEAYGKPLTDDDLGDGIALPDPSGWPWRVKKIRYDAKADKAARTAAKTARQQRWRAGVAAKKPPKPPRFPVKDVSDGMKRCFYDYVSRGDTPLARSLHGRIKAHNLIAALNVYLDYANQLGRDPTRKQFAKAMAWRPHGDRKAERTVAVLSKVFAEGGFGTDAELAKGAAEMAKAEDAEWAWVSTEDAGAASTSPPESTGVKLLRTRDVSQARLQGEVSTSPLEIGK